MYEPRLDLVVADFLQCANDRLERALHVALDDEREFLAPGVLELLHHLLERALVAGRSESFATLAHPVIGDLASPRFILDDGKLVARFRS